VHTAAEADTTHLRGRCAEREAIPISGVRCVTEKDITAHNPATARKSGAPPGAMKMAHIILYERSMSVSIWSMEISMRSSIAQMIALMAEA
jgi:hypothetical protein